jgi:hypothetical protein
MSQYCVLVLPLLVVLHEVAYDYGNLYPPAAATDTIRKIAPLLRPLPCFISGPTLDGLYHNVTHPRTVHVTCINATLPHVAGVRVHPAWLTNTTLFTLYGGVPVRAVLPITWRRAADGTPYPAPRSTDVYLANQ